MNRKKVTKLAAANQPFTPVTKKPEIDDNSFQPLQLADLQTPKTHQKSHSSSSDDTEPPIQSKNVEKIDQEISLDDIRAYFVKGIEMIDKYKAQQKQQGGAVTLKSNLKHSHKQLNNFDDDYQFDEQKLIQPQNKKITLYKEPTLIPDENQDENSSEVKIKKLSNNYIEKETPIEKKNSPKFSDFPISPTNFSKISSGSPQTSESKYSDSGEDLQQRMMQMSALLRRLEKQLDNLN